MGKLTRAYQVKRAERKAGKGWREHNAVYSIFNH